MFDFIRKHTKWTMALLFLLIVPSFILVGMNSNHSAEKGRVVAKVDGTEITQPEWDRAHLSEVDRLRASMPTLDAKLLDTPEARYATLERMVRDRVVAVAAEKLKLSTSNQHLARELQSSPEIAALRRADGSLDMERYRQLLGAQGLSPEMFEANVRSDLSRRQVLAGVSGSGLTSSVAADLALNAFFEKREIQLARFNAADYASKLSPSDADIEQFYKANEKLFQAPEQASIEYVVLDLDTVTKGIAVNDADLKTYYEQNAKQLSSTEERRASHILITAPVTASAAQREEAKAKAEALLAAIRKAPDTFAEVARKNSQDPGSAAGGGDLDFFGKGAMVKPFEDAAFSMQKGDISDVVASDFGYHIIKLTDIKVPKQRSFEEMKPMLEADLKKQQAQKKFSETAEAFSNAVYEQSDSLKPVADRLKLEIKTAATVLRQPASGVSGPLGNAKFLNALFSPDAIEKKRNTEAVEVGSNQLVSGRIVQYTPARTLPLAEVKGSVRQRWLAQHGAEEARKDGIAKLAAWKASPAAATLASPIFVSREQSQQLPAPLVDAAMRADTSVLPSFVGVDSGVQGYAIVKINKVVPRDRPAETAALQERNQYGQQWASAETLAYYNGLKDRFKAEILVTKPALGLQNPEAAASR
ncbi:MULTISPECIES: SurA N-terminal domain-containing protein [unclassified Polaromonas]|uniref:SurA N-terminal domain-containing protein n=1 Tax=unclassified Polaromonas TaxID=2638319 RepID=UPI0018C8D750|nr:MULTISPECIES: SurA N-terminal domain-containing protein [unclassified Polaromonas]MBG6072667.1 peptidyl-prolyl cis-trans isomerase D [Polaromonas sp. CG_9.7]MBG6114614.1 peptidyl-prolyl cis-trans isomerase D [Polaromonas sp. CG_9.2]MDH6185225.1 peptidyl-prolyl cis-trans isomerase D [Polaromonas sp. CG_23.6]